MTSFAATLARICLICCVVASGADSIAAEDNKTTFASWLVDFRSDAQQFGIHPATLDAAFRDLTPDLSLPDLDLPATAGPPKGQAEFTRPPQDYVSERQIARLARQGRELLVTHRKTLAAIEARFRVPASVVLAIWGRETAYGTYKVRHDAIRALATQAYRGRRADMFRIELLSALKLIQDGVIRREAFRSSWAGAFGLTQFMPSEFATLAVDFDGDGRRDLWSVPDALASAANQLKSKGWLAEQPWGYEVTLPKGVTCAEDGPATIAPIQEWATRGVQRVTADPFSPAASRFQAFMFSPGGSQGPVFLVTENFLVFKRYNMSDLYALFVGHLADRIHGGGPFATGWSAIRQLSASRIKAVQTVLKEEGFDIGMIDGRIGPNTRSQIGRYQLREKLDVTCWPTDRLYRAMRIGERPPKK